MKNLLTVFCLLMLALISCERPGIDNGNGDGDIDTTNIVWGDYFPSAEYQGDHEGNGINTFFVTLIDRNVEFTIGPTGYVYEGTGYIATICLYSAGKGILSDGEYTVNKNQSDFTIYPGPGISFVKVITDGECVEKLITGGTVSFKQITKEEHILIASLKLADGSEAKMNFKGYIRFDDYSAQ